MQSSIKDASWANQAYGIKKTYYGENLQLINDEEMNLLNRNTIFQCTIVPINTPSWSKIHTCETYQQISLFTKKQPSQGKAFPFDYLQTSVSI